MIVISDEKKFMEMMQSVYNKGCEHMYVLMAGIKEDEANAPVAITELATKYNKDKNTLLRKVKRLRLPLLSRNPVKIRQRDVEKLLAA